MVKKGIDITVYTTNVGLSNIPKGYVSDAVIDGVKVRYFNFKRALEFVGSRGWQYSPELKKELLKNINGFDIVYIIALWSYPSSIAAYYCRRLKKPYIISPRGMLYSEALRIQSIKKRLYYWLMKDNIHGASAIHYTSEHERDSCHDRLNFRNKAIVVPNGIDIKGAEIKQALDNDNFIPDIKNKRPILFMARINKVKGLDMLIKAFALVLRDVGNAHLVIAGSAEGKYFNSVKKLVTKLNLNGKVTYLDFLKEESKKAAYLSSEVFVLPSRFESFGMSAVEAMALGVPVVLTDKVGISSEAQKYGAAVVVPATESELYKGIKSLLENREFAAEVGANAKRFVAARYSIDNVAQKMIEEFDSVLGKTDCKIC